MDTKEFQVKTSPNEVVHRINSEARLPSSRSYLHHSLTKLVGKWAKIVLEYFFNYYF